MLASQVYQTNTDNSATRRRRDREKDYQRQKLKALTDFVHYTDLVMYTYRLNYAAARDLLTVCALYLEQNIGTTPYIITKLYNRKTGTYRALQQRLKLLKEKELIQYLNKQYFPTDKAIKELSKLSKQITDKK